MIVEAQYVTAHKTYRIYKVIVLPTLEEMVPNIREYQFELNELLAHFTVLTEEYLEYDICFPLEYIIHDMLHVASNNASSMRELELDYGYIYSELNSVAFQDAGESFSGDPHKEELIHDGNVAENLSEIAEVMARVVLDFFKYVRKSDYIIGVDISCVNEIIVHDTEHFCAVQYLTHVTRKEGDDVGIRLFPS